MEQKEEGRQMTSDTSTAPAEPARVGPGPEEVFGFASLQAVGGRILTGGTITSAGGVAAGAASAGLRRSGRPDVALVGAERAAAAGVFTRNKAKAAPVLVSISTLARSREVWGIVANAGCANALTGERGLADAKAMQSEAARSLGAPEDSVLVASTGIIGTYLPIESVMQAVSSISLGTDDPAGHEAASAIMTTDTFPKECAVSVSTPFGEFRVGAVAKGAAMLEPSMATMLAFVATDARVEPETLHEVLGRAVSRTFNRISVDACMSTNDCVFALATGVSGVTVGGGPDSVDPAVLQACFDHVCGSLALDMVRDGEGSSRFAVLRVKGAYTPEDAERVARRIAGSSLVRCSLYGGDPYWGRILSEAGSVAEVFDPDRSSVAYGPYVVCQGGVGTELWHSVEVSRYLEGTEVEVVCDLGVGDAEAVRVMASLGPGYVEENMRTS